MSDTSRAILNHDDTKRPFHERARLTREHLDGLIAWLQKRADPGHIVAGSYTVANLIDDLAAIGAGVYNELVDYGIEGEDLDCPTDDRGVPIKF
jgi:hypothetical protein